MKGLKSNPGFKFELLLSFSYGCIIPETGEVSFSIYPYYWEWSMSKFPCSLTRNMTSHSMENLTFHSLLRWKVIILQFSLHPSYNRFLKGWENTLFELRNERVKNWRNGFFFLFSIKFEPFSSPGIKIEEFHESWITVGSVSAALSGPAFVPLGKERRLNFPSQRLETEPRINYGSD